MVYQFISIETLIHKKIAYMFVVCQSMLRLGKRRGRGVGVLGRGRHTV